MKYEKHKRKRFPSCEGCQKRECQHQYEGVPYEDDNHDSNGKILKYEVIRYPCHSNND